MLKHKTTLTQARLGPGWGQIEKIRKYRRAKRVKRWIGRGKGRRSPETCLWCCRSIITRIWYHVLIGQTSSCCQIRGAVDRIALSSCSYTSGKVFLKHGFRASHTNFFARLFAYPSTPRRAKNTPVICCKKKKKHSKYVDFFLILSSSKLRSHLQRDWLINRGLKGTA